MADIDDEIKTLRVAADLLYEAGHVKTGREVTAIVRRLRDNQPCRTCAGAGVRELAEWERIALAALRPYHYPIATTLVMRLAWPGIKRAAACNRLAAMERNGLVVSSRDPGDAREKMWKVRRG